MMMSSLPWIALLVVYLVFSPSYDGTDLLLNRNLAIQLLELHISEHLVVF
jgi:hypothetical protein